MKMRDHIIISGSADGTVKVWNGESGESLHTLCGHIDPVSCVFIHERRVESGSRDHTIRIWDIETGQCLDVLTVQLHNITYIHYDGERVVSVDGTDSGTLNFWDPKTQSCLITFPSPIYQHIQHSELKGSRLLLVTGTITVWDTGEPIQTITHLQIYTQGQ
ncbi:F-box/WD repeat-containing protein 7-like [Xenopus laevis]|uniref:F-box/WD repeat-containing protein 7-like n=1 Tax=Xenopus laevis TaxID=8355 RepID=A0A8J1MW96_XENLA|nr:F-box/WD repeat-containing protein 7-like [Xenopus laevis]